MKKQFLGNPLRAAVRRGLCYIRLRAIIEGRRRDFAQYAPGPGDKQRFAYLENDLPRTLKNELDGGA